MKLLTQVRGQFAWNQKKKKIHIIWSFSRSGSIPGTDRNEEKGPQNPKFFRLTQPQNLPGLPKLLKNQIQGL